MIVITITTAVKIGTSAPLRESTHVVKRFKSPLVRGECDSRYDSGGYKLIW